MTGDLETFKIIKNGYICEYKINYDYMYDKFMKKIKNKYSIKEEAIKLNDVEETSFGKIIELRKYDEVLNKQVIHTSSQARLKYCFGKYYVNVIFDGIKYPYIYNLLKHEFKIDKLEDLNVWMDSNKENNDISELNKQLRMSIKADRSHYRYSNDSQIENKEKLMDKYFKLINFKLINKMSLIEYKAILKNSIISTDKVLEELAKQYEIIENNTKIVEESCFKDIINEKLDKTFEVKKGRQKVKK